MQHIIKIALPDIPGQCGGCGAASDQWPLSVYGGQVNVTCPVCFCIVAPVVAVPLATTPAPATAQLSAEDRDMEHIIWLSGGNGEPADDNSD